MQYYNGVSIGYAVYGIFLVKITIWFTKKNMLAFNGFYIIISIISKLLTTNLWYGYLFRYIRRHKYSHGILNLM